MDESLLGVRPKHPIKHSITVSEIVLTILWTIKYKKYPRQIKGAIMSKKIIGPIILNIAKNI